MSNVPTVHERYELLFPDFLLGLLAPEAVEEVERHLMSCGACRERLDEMKAVFKILRDSPAPPPPTHYFPNLLPRVRRRIEEREASRFFSDRPLQQLVYPLAALALAVALIITLPTGGDQSGLGGLRDAVGSAGSEDLMKILEEQAGQGTVAQLAVEEAVIATVPDRLVARELGRTIMDEKVIADEILPLVLSDVNDTELEFILQKLGERTVL